MTEFHFGSLQINCSNHAMVDQAAQFRLKRNIPGGLTGWESRPAWGRISLKAYCISPRRPRDAHASCRVELRQLKAETPCGAWRACEGDARNPARNDRPPGGAISWPDGCVRAPDYPRPGLEKGCDRSLDAVAVARLRFDGPGASELERRWMAGCRTRMPHTIDDPAAELFNGESAILLVEDDQADVMLLRQALRKAQVTNLVSVVKDGQEAIQYLSREGPYADRPKNPSPFLVLLDLRLPKLSGFEVLEWIRDQKDLAGLVVIVMTGSDHVPDVNKAHELGANSYLVKPTSFHELVGLVKGIKDRWLTTGRHSAASPASSSVK
jgi:CheY-like chemotaxis protein